MKDWNDLIEEAVNAMRKARDARRAVWVQHVPDETEASREYDQAIYKQACCRDWHFKLQEKFKLHPVVKTLLKQHQPTNWQQLLLEWPHVSETDQSRLAYTRDEKHGEADRQTITTIGKYIKRHWPELKDHVLRDAQATYHPDKLEIGQGIEYLVKAVELGPRSCMQSGYGTIPFNSEDLRRLKRWLVNPETNVSWYDHPYSVYSAQYGWKMAIRVKDSNIDGRCLLLDDGEHKVFVRSYARAESDEHQSQTDHILETWLREAGFEKVKAWPQGSKLDVVDHPSQSSEYLLPYIDGSGDNDRKLTLEDDHFEVSCDGNYVCNNTNGLADEHELCRCEDCGDSVSRDDLYFVHESDRLVCEDCYQNYVWAYSSRGSRGSGGSVQVRRDQTSHLFSNYYRWLRDETSGSVVDADIPDDVVYIDNRETYCRVDDAVRCTDEEWYFFDDPEIVRLAEECPSSEERYALRSNAWQDSSGQWFSNEENHATVNGAFEKESDCWQCDGTGDWYLNTDAPIIMASGEEIHESFFDRVSSDAEWGDDDTAEVRQYQIDDEVLPSTIRKVTVWKGTSAGASLNHVPSQALGGLLDMARAMIGGSVTADPFDELNWINPARIARYAPQVSVRDSDLNSFLSAI